MTVLYVTPNRFTPPEVGRLTRALNNKANRGRGELAMIRLCDLPIARRVVKVVDNDDAGGLMLARQVGLQIDVRVLKCRHREGSGHG
jgi:hypothetical protein